MTISDKPMWRKFSSLTLVVVSLAYIVYFFVNEKDSLHITFSISLPMLLGIVVLQLMYYAIQSWRFQIILEKCSGKGLPYIPWTRIFILGRFLNIVFSQLGNVYRGVQLKKVYRIPYVRYISSFTSMAWIDICMSLIMAIFLIWLLEPSLELGNTDVWKILAALFLAVMLGPIFLMAIINKSKPDHPKLLWIHDKLSEVFHITVNNLSDRLFLGKIIGLGILLFIRTMVVFYLYFLAFGTHVPLAVLAVFFALFKLSFFIILTPGNIGIQEIAWGFLSEQVGIGMEIGILMSGFIRLVSVGVLAACGIAFGGADLIRNRKTYRTHSTTNKF